MRLLLAVMTMMVRMALSSADAQEALPQPAGDVILTVSGAITRTNAPGEARFDRAMLDSIGTRTFTTSVYWLDGPRRFVGYPLKAVLERVGANGTRVKALALNDYEAYIPLADLKFDPILAAEMDGAMLTPYDKGPLWLVYPRDAHAELKESLYDQRYVWMLNRLVVD